MLTVFQNKSVYTLCFILAAFLLLPQANAGAALPESLMSTQLDWVCVTDDTLAEAYEALAEYRRGQGLSAIVIPLSEALRWSPVDNDTTASLRWLAITAHQQWGASYLLLGGSHELLAAPTHRLSVGEQDFDSPTDAYYACLDGQWDVDGDGLVAEWEEDAADPTVHLKVGRLPADDAQTVTDVIAKIIAFENRSTEAGAGGLFVSSHMLSPYQELPESSGWALQMAEEMREISLSTDPNLRVGTLYQGLRDEYNPLSEEALVDSLGARGHDFVYCQLRGVPPSWSLDALSNITAPAFDPLQDAGHSFLLSMLTGDVGDMRGPGIIRSLLNMRDGGAVVAFAPSGLSYVYSQILFQRLLWPRLMDHTYVRVGDVHAAARASFVVESGFASFSHAATYWALALFGDPATLIRPVTAPASVLPVAASPANVRAIPNPFNPHTQIAFEVEGVGDRLSGVVVEIFDLQGRRVETLLEAALPPGPHSVRWYAKSASGLYFARVSVDGQTETIKVMLAK